MLARQTGQRQADVLRMSPGGINVVQQKKPARSCGCPLYADQRVELDTWDCSPYVQTPKGEAYTADRFRAAWTPLMNDTPAGRVRAEGFTFHGLRASSCEKLREIGCSDEEIGSITGMSPPMIRRYLRFADQRKLAKAAFRCFEEAEQKL
jgi:hypothetical protein